MARRGPEETTGRFKTREELELYVHRLHASSDLTRRDIADDCEVSVGTIQHILKKGRNIPTESFQTLKRKMLLGKW